MLPKSNAARTGVQRRKVMPVAGRNGFSAARCARATAACAIDYNETSSIATMPVWKAEDVANALGIH
jgi:hypothetical protein